MDTFFSIFRILRSKLANKFRSNFEFIAGQNIKTEKKLNPERKKNGKKPKKDKEKDTRPANQIRFEFY